MAHVNGSLEGTIYKGDIPWTMLGGIGGPMLTEEDIMRYMLGVLHEEFGKGDRLEVVRVLDSGQRVPVGTYRNE